jgi:hypothetical protein
MPRKKRDFGAIRTVDILSHVDLDHEAGCLQRENRPPRRRGEESDGEQEEEGEFHNVCPCRNCARLPRPSVRFMSVIGRHIRSYRTEPTYEVNCWAFHSLQHIIRENPLTA